MGISGWQVNNKCHLMSHQWMAHPSWEWDRSCLLWPPEGIRLCPSGMCIFLWILWYPDFLLTLHWLTISKILLQKRGSRWLLHQCFYKNAQSVEWKSIHLGTFQSQLPLKYCGYNPSTMLTSFHPLYEHRGSIVLFPALIRSGLN